MSSSSAPILQAAAYSRWLAARLAADPELEGALASALQQPVTIGEIHERLAAAAPGDEAALGEALRRLRSWVLARVMTRDLAGLADLAEVTAAMTALAELAIARAVDLLHADLAGVYGQPLDAAGRPQRLMVVGMGKLGGGELNVSSDIDLVFVYPEDGETAGPRCLSNHEFFVRLGRRLIRLLDESTAHGRVFRVDMRLRPNGDSGPLAVSLAMLEHYFYTQAREWERYAWIKGRVLTGERADELEALRRPFVFRRYLDYGAFAAMRALHAQIRQEVARRERADDIKLGPGGIREIEFIAQVYQLIRGGREPALQERPTRAILARLATQGHLPAEQARYLDEAYVWLRNLEHRLQYLDDAQTHRLPAAEDDRARLAQAMGAPDWAAFAARLARLRQRVGELFEQVFGAPQEDQSAHPLAGLWRAPAEEAAARLAGLGYADAPAVAARLIEFTGSSRFRSLPASSQTALESLLPPVLELAAGTPNADATLTRLLDLIEAISRRSPYLRLLQEYPQALGQLTRLASASPWAAQYLTAQPHLLDELLDARSLLQEPDWTQARAELSARLEQLKGDTERQMDALRHFKQAMTLRLLTQDLSGRLSLERLSDHLSALADLLVEATLRLVWANMGERHRAQPAFAVIAYGKLGGKELGYASDLDLVFLYADDHPEAQAIYARLAKRLITWLTTHTAAGQLYDTDVRLRPDGAAGLLVSSLAAFESYQRDKAWTWEHQALTRARYCCGDGAVGEGFEAIRREILCLPRAPERLKAEVLAMRQKMRAGHPNPTALFDLKHDPGGLVDVEFAVQYLVLAHAHAYPALTDNIGNIALLRRCAELGLLPAEVALPAADAYRELRRLQHAAKLQGAHEARSAPEPIEPLRQAVLRLWQTVFATAADQIKC
ncbi:MAG: bifunctional [glutamate--ammonia ligase]-adenylyl-L-tyrosine phosphorylase/[glutamate--ammonia-ligase] adenylyltransferase [Thiobacillaceae bacterium]|nr:bifunctional [glutamate--ammonia ligase]-adenylyl-L-tyrosine phosphorylase/[glutamate--ammonia-ligase] adenylyltransferase [Thiobacillaceae bacterium]MCX7673221.1 bifunctional [glutamate--ammonia ligase]-adenylyl-L-tyrosine phosphorylase/[glutamate--ammonia-ligase] adenylyltransferase [Thiobacillaceae bacterium]MDW8324369.1 bifunctional [glutamate--ammonia ligase]-adenylyl-L-tyrosine phosphorylase/[glutamate--ammonia-ligase] adenylyltransferase [Burkholderiales bacterium]